MRPEENSETVEFAIKLQDVLLPIDSHWPVEKYKAIDDAYNANDKELQAEARKDLAAAFRLKAKSVNLKYIAPPKSTDFAIVYVPTEGLFAELSSYRDPKTKELLLHELRTKYKITISGPNTLSALLQSYHLGFMTLKVAIIGSGPSGFYTADSLIKSGEDVEIDIIDRLPTPFGLIRGGVAPDHQTTKKVAKAYEKTALNESVNYFGNVEVGKDISKLRKV